MMLNRIVAAHQRDGDADEAEAAGEVEVMRCCAPMTMLSAANRQRAGSPSPA